MDALDRAWRRRIGFGLAGMLLVVGLLGLVVLPVMQGIKDGIDPLTAICRAIGIPTGGPAPVGPAVAATVPPSRVAWTAPDFAVLAAADRQAGAALAQANCVACHVVDGSTPDPSIPHMAGQSAFAIFKELQDFKSGARANEIMAPLARPLDDRQMAALSVYYAGLSLPGGLDAAHPSFAGADIEALVLRGDTTRALPPCAACHAAGSGGPIETPGLTGQPLAYVAGQLQAFADGSRRNDVFARMRAIAAKLTPREMSLLGAYYTTPH